jgi:hypothetical protein
MAAVARDEVAAMTIDEARSLLSLPEDERRVRYSRDGWFPGEGVVTSVSERFAFVRYEGDVHSKATDPADLTLLAGKVPGDV